MHVSLNIMIFFPPILMHVNFSILSPNLLPVFSANGGGGGLE